MQTRVLSITVRENGSVRLDRMSANVPLMETQAGWLDLPDHLSYFLAEVRDRITEAYADAKGVA